MGANQLLLTNIGQLNGILDPEISCLKGSEMADVKSISNAFLKVVNGRITAFGPMEQCPELSNESDVRDMKGQWIMPGFVDSHTHMVFAASRHNEYVMRLQGKTYEEIAAAGGGILNSASRLASMSEDELYSKAMDHARMAMKHGTVAIEIKSGYGLSTASELKMLRVIKRMKAELPIQVRSTFLGAHAFPAAFKNDHDAYISLITEEMLPAIAEEDLADFVDVFCDTGFFSPAETARILNKASTYGLRAKIHGNELGISGGVQVAVEHRALSVDHLEHIGQAEIDCLLASDTMPVALPGSSFFLKIPYTPARKMIDSGLPIALASDFNPGSSPTYNLWFIWSLACLYNGLLPAEAFNALTINAAKAMGIESTHGSISIGKVAALTVTDPFDNLAEIPYWIGRNHCKEQILF